MAIRSTVPRFQIRVPTVDKRQFLEIHKSMETDDWLVIYRPDRGGLALSEPEVGALCRRAEGSAGETFRLDFNESDPMITEVKEPEELAETLQRAPNGRERGLGLGERGSMVIYSDTAATGLSFDDLVISFPPVDETTVDSQCLKLAPQLRDPALPFQNRAHRFVDAPGGEERICETCGVTCEHPLWQRVATRDRCGRCGKTGV